MLLMHPAPIPGVTLREDDHGQVQVLEAPPLAEVACALLGRRDLRYLAADEAGNLVIAGSVVYRPLRLRAHPTGEFMLICERVR